GYFCLWDVDSGRVLDEQILPGHCTLSDRHAETEGLIIGPPIENIPNALNPDERILLGRPFVGQCQISVFAQDCERHVATGDLVTLPVISFLNQGLINYAKPDPIGGHMVFWENNLRRGSEALWSWAARVPFLGHLCDDDRCGLTVRDVRTGNTVAVL